MYVMRAKRNKQTFVDGSRRRRYSDNPAKRQWYAEYRNARFARRLTTC